MSSLRYVRNIFHCQKSFHLVRGSLSWSGAPKNFILDFFWDTLYVVWLNWISGPNATEISLLVHTLCVCGSRRNYCDRSHHMLPSPLPFPSDDGSKQTVQLLKLGVMARLIVGHQIGYCSHFLTFTSASPKLSFSSIFDMFQIYTHMRFVFPFLFLLHNRLMFQVR